MFSARFLPLLLLTSVYWLNAAPRAQFIFEKAPFPSCHASTILEASPGEFLAAWFGGREEGANDVAIWGARLTKGGWSEPFEMVRETNTPAWNPVLFAAADGTIWLYYKFGPSPQTWTAGRRASRDGGRTWLAPEHLPAGVYGPIKDKPLVLGDGTIVSGTSVESYLSWSCWVEVSRDNGKTWTRHGPIMPEGPAPAKPLAPMTLAAVPGSEYWHRTHGIIQPAVVPLGAKRIRMFVRATQDIGRICYSDSTDGGVTWTPAKATALPNPNSGIDAVGLRDGRIAMVYNHTRRGRTPLNIAVSRDGDHWNNFLALETEPGEFSYPAIIQARDGSLHVTYTWNRKKIKHVVVPLEEVP
ncbi:MAG: exo-alpha-sialidase [Acidobacteria bacterium]|nr:exo-alpha-sialidase [Acidobacteriota bacterium]